MAEMVPSRELRASLSTFLDKVTEQREHLLVTRHGHPAAAIIPVDEYEALEETANILSDPATMRAIEEGLSELATGDSVSLEDLRSDLKRLREKK